MLEVDIVKKYKQKSREVKIAFSAVFEQGKTTAIYGSSGIGKTTVIRMLAGLDLPDSGYISLDKTDWYNATLNTNLSIRQRKIGLVFQDYNLFPTMTVERNLRYASFKNEISNQTKNLLEILGISSLLNSYPNTLSKGQIQRVAIVRALCQEPDFLLLDEPFSALDDEVIASLIGEMKRIQKSIQTTIILVSHRVDIIRHMADNVVIMKSGEEIKQGHPIDLLPKNLMND